MKKINARAGIARFHAARAGAGTGRSRTRPVAPPLTAEEARRDPRLDLRPLAAYVLAFYTETVAFWQRWYVEVPWAGSNVPDILEYLEQACEILRPDVPAGAAAGIVRVMDRIRFLDQLVANAQGWTKKGRYALYEFAPELIETHRRDIKIEASRYNDGSRPYHAWGSLGQAIGRWDYDRDVSDLPGYPEDLPLAAFADLRWVARLAASLPGRDRARSPHAARLADLVDEQSYPDAASICRAFGQYFPEASAGPSAARQGDSWLWNAMRYVHGNLLEELVYYPAEPDRAPDFAGSALQPVAAEPDRPPGFAGPALQPVAAEPDRPPIPTSPRWDAQTGVLFFGDQEVRTVAGNAEQGIAVLDAFQAAGWPESIPNPIRVRDRGKLSDTIKNLNKGLRLIRFRRRLDLVIWTALE
jgi:hypothetical protein